MPKIFNFKKIKINQNIGYLKYRIMMTSKTLSTSKHGVFIQKGQPLNYS